MPWGQQAGVTDLVQRLQSNDAGLTSLFILAIRRFGSEVACCVHSLASPEQALT